MARGEQVGMRNRHGLVEVGMSFIFASVDARARFLHTQEALDDGHLRAYCARNEECVVTLYLLLAQIERVARERMEATRVAEPCDELRAENRRVRNDVYPVEDDLRISLQHVERYERVSA